MKNIKAKVQSKLELSRELADIKYAIDQAAIIAITDGKGVITNVNEQFCEISKYAEVELIGQTHRKVNSNHHSSSFFREMWKTISRGNVWRGEIKNRAKDGSFYWVDTTIVPIMNDEGEVEQYISFRSDITDRKRMEKALRTSEEKYRKLALYDQLTGLPNWTYMEEEMNQHILKGQPFHFLTLDMDRFKFINESYGLSYGDQLLKRVAKRLLSFQQDDMVIARRGGDEYVFLCPVKSQDDTVLNIIDKLLAIFQEPFEIMGKSLHVHVSIGVSTFPVHGVDSDTLFRYADMAMYKAKEKMGNSYSIYTTHLQEDLNDRWELETDLRHALTHQHFELAYQPIFDIHTKEVTSVEVLIRWNHEKRGYISPATFIPLAEERGLIVEIGDWVMREAIAHYQKYSQIARVPVKLSINVSIIQLVQENFVKNLKGLLQEYEMDPANLKLEITETATVKHLKYINDVLYELKEQNILLAIDDFGTGYSSLNYLRRLPVDIVKIDRSFIQDMHDNQVDFNILKAITSVCQSLNLQTVAEGVETEQQLARLIECECDKVQGYLLGKPMTLTTFIDFLQDSQLNRKSS